MPIRLAELIKRAKNLGLEYEDGGTRHPHRFRKPGARPYTVPAHNGIKTEISDEYVDGLCKCFDIDPEDIRDRKRNKAKKKERR